MIAKGIRYRALATDYDETLATSAAVDGTVVDGLRRVKASGRHLVLVTGRQLDDLLSVCPEIELFDRAVVENGAVLYRPDTREAAAQAAAPSKAFVDRLRRKRVAPLSLGQVIVATLETQERPVSEAIRELELDLQMIFNKGALMILPQGIDKASGLRLALQDVQVSPEQVVGIGDAENDHAFLDACGCGVAVANAIPALKDRADLVTESPAGAGVLEVIERLVSSDLAGVGRRVARAPR